MNTRSTPQEDSGPEPVLTDQQRERLAEDPDAVLAEVFSQHRDSFWYLVTFRMDRRLGQRVDPDDVLQEAFLAAKSRIRHYIDGDGQHSLFAWLRLIVVQTLVDVHRRHLGAEKRSAGREVRLGSVSVAYPQTTSLSIAGQIAAVGTSPSGAAMRGEALAMLEGLIASLSAQDQEVIAMRHFENLTNLQVAEVMEISPTAASNRYVRALERLRDVLEKAGVELPK